MTIIVTLEVADLVPAELKNSSKLDSYSQSKCSVEASLIMSKFTKFSCGDGGCMGHGGCHRYVYVTSASDQGCEYGNQFYFSFGLDDR